MSQGWRACVVCIVLTFLFLTGPGLGAPVPGTNDAPANNALRADKYGDPLPPFAVARLGTVRLRHGDSVNSLAFSPDGKTLASAGDDCFAILWDVASGKEVRALPHPHPVRAVLFTPDGKTLLTASNHSGDTRVHLWDVRSGEQIRSLKMAEPNAITHMVLHPDAKTLFASTEEGPVVSLELPGGRQVWADKEDGDSSTCLALTPDGKTLATGNRKGQVCFRDVRTGKPVKSLPMGNNPAGCVEVYSLAFSPDGQTLAVSDDVGGLRCWDVVAGKWARQIAKPASPVVALAFAHGGKLASASGRTLCLYDPAGGKEVARLDARESWIYGVTFSPDGRYLATAGRDNTVRVWYAATLEPLHPFASEPGGRCSASFGREGGRLISSNSDGFQYNPCCVRRAWNARSVETLRNSKPKFCVSGPGCLSPDGKVFACPDEQGRVRLVDVNSRKNLHTVGKEGDGFHAEPVAFSPDGQAVAVLSDELGRVLTRGIEERHQVRLWDVRTGRLVAAALEGDWSYFNHFAYVQFSTRGRLLVAQEGRWGAANLIHLWYFDPGKGLRRLKTPELLDEYHPAVSPDGWLLTTRGVAEKDGAWDGAKSKPIIRVREIISGKVILCLEDQAQSCCIALSPDNRLVALSDDAGTVRLVEVASGKEVQRLQGHRGLVLSLEFSANGNLLVSGGMDTTALVWDLRACLTGANADEVQRPGAALWSDLASEDAATAFRATQTLVGNPEEGVVLLKRLIRPLRRAAADLVQGLITDLDHDQFDVRERAAGRLRDLERTAVPLLKKALKTTKSAEARCRLERLLAEAEDPRNSPERLRDLRAIHCLTAIGTPPARHLLQTLAEGAPEALLTQQAREELDWLARR